MRQHLETDDTGPSAFKRLLQLLTVHLDTGDQGEGFIRRHANGVPTNTVLTSYLRCVKYIIPIIHGTKNLSKPSDAIVIESIRSSISRHYPALIPALLPGVLMTTPET